MKRIVSLFLALVLIAALQLSVQGDLVAVPGFWDDEPEALPASTAEPDKPVYEPDEPASVTDEPAIAPAKPSAQPSDGTLSSVTVMVLALAIVLIVSALLIQAVSRKRGNEKR